MFMKKKVDKNAEILTNANFHSLHTILRFYQALCKPCKSKIRLCHMCVARGLSHITSSLFWRFLTPPPPP